MNDKDFKKGSVEAFDSNWADRKETKYFHFNKNNPETQIQLAFSENFKLFNEILDKPDFTGRVLEVGCGRGSVSAYYANNGWDCTLLDLSKEAIDRAKEAFNANGLEAKFDVGDALNLPYEDATFDLTFSIGLLEHFEDSTDVIAEQKRVLKDGGLFIAYVVPDFEDNIQYQYEWVNELLRLVQPSQDNSEKPKDEVFRSDNLSSHYMEIMNKLDLNKTDVTGCFPLPMVSHSPDFPFSLLNPNAEKHLVKTFKKMLSDRAKKLNMNNPWRCDVDFGQALVISGIK